MLGNLLHGDLLWLDRGEKRLQKSTFVLGYAKEDEELKMLNIWMNDRLLSQGELAYDFSDPDPMQTYVFLDSSPIRNPRFEVIQSPHTGHSVRFTFCVPGCCSCGLLSGKC